MSSFQYSDNFSGFNDLINRVDFLTEAKIGKAHPSFKGLAGRIKKDPRSGGKGFPRDARMLIKTVLYGVDIFKDEDLATLRAAGVEASSKYRETLEALLDKYEDVIKSKAGKIADKLEDEFERFVNDQALMVGADRKEAYLAKKEAKAAADAFEKEIQGGGDVVDAVGDAVGEVEQSTADAFGGPEAEKQLTELPDELDVRFDTLPDKDNIIAKMVDKFNQIRPNIKASPMSGGTGFTVEGPVGAFNNIDKTIIDNILGISPHAKKDDINIQVYSSADEDFEQSFYGDEEDSYEENELPSSTQEEDEVDDLIMNNDKEAFILTVTDNVKRALKRALDRYGILFNDVEEGLTVAIEDEQDAVDLAGKIGRGRDNKFIGESYTDGYMSDQSSSDKRNKKKEVLSESFKDRYKPKTHWQLEELRRYGL